MVLHLLSTPLCQSCLQTLASIMLEEKSMVSFKASTPSGDLGSRLLQKFVNLFQWASPSLLSRTEILFTKRTSNFWCMHRKTLRTQSSSCIQHVDQHSQATLTAPPASKP